MDGRARLHEGIFMLFMILQWRIFAKFTEIESGQGKQGHGVQDKV